MFSIKEDAITSRKSHFERALKKLPVVHREAQQVGIRHLHQKVSEAATSAGLDSGPITVAWDRGRAYIGITAGSAGDKVADHEFGTPDQAPNPVMRRAHTAAMSEANRRYVGHLRRGLQL
jgi:hypothetical protein